MDVSTYERDSSIKVKLVDAVTLSTVIWPAYAGGMGTDPVDVKTSIAAGIQIAKDKHHKKFVELGGIGVSKLDTSVCINHYGTMFRVDERTTEEQALERYEYLMRKKKRERIGLHPV